MQFGNSLRLYEFSTILRMMKIGKMVVAGRFTVSWQGGILAPTNTGDQRA